jgi:hypothetical protein
MFPPSDAAILKESTASIYAIIPCLATQILSILSRRCAEPLRLIRSVVAQVRTSKKEPSEPSYFVPGILKPLKAYLEGPASVLDDSLKRQWATDVVADVATRFFLLFSWGGGGNDPEP